MLATVVSKLPPWEAVQLQPVSQSAPVPFLEHRLWNGLQAWCSLDLQRLCHVSHCGTCCRSFRRAAAAGEELKVEVVHQLLKVLSAGAFCPGHMNLSARLSLSNLTYQAVTHSLLQHNDQLLAHPQCLAVLCSDHTHQAGGLTLCLFRRCKLVPWACGCTHIAFRDAS